MQKKLRINEKTERMKKLKIAIYSSMINMFFLNMPFLMKNHFDILYEAQMRNRPSQQIIWLLVKFMLYKYF